MIKVNSVLKSVFLSEFFLFWPCLFMLSFSNVAGGAPVFIITYAAFLVLYFRFCMRRSLLSLEDKPSPNFGAHFFKVDLSFFIKFFVLFVLPLWPMSFAYLGQSEPPVELIEEVIANNGFFIEQSQRILPISKVALENLYDNYDVSKELVIYFFSLSFFFFNSASCLFFLSDHKIVA